MTTEHTPAGWYPDPTGDPGQKYWDGQQWSTDGGATDLSSQSAPYLPASGAPGPGAYGVDAYGRPLSDKSKLVAGLLQIFLSPFAVGRFYLGYNNIAIAQVAAAFLTCGLGAWWAIIDGIMILMGRVPDPEGRTLRD
jgi:TM2 domain-containing membrane protein YozV